MKLKKRRTLTTTLATLAVLFLTSCNRGYGCPTNFSIDDAWTLLINMLF